MKHFTRWSPRLRPPSRLGLPSSLSGATCAFLFVTSLDPAVGEEIVLAMVTATEEEGRDLAVAEPFSVGAVCGVLPTVAGPVLSLLWTVADPAGGWEPRAIHHSLYDPADSATLAPLRRLASQSHWHVAVVGPERRVHRWAQVEDRFQLGEALEACVELARPLGPTDLATARRAVDARWTPLDVLAAHAPPPPLAGRDLVDDLVALLSHAVERGDRSAGRAVAAVAHARGGRPAMELVLESYRGRLRPPAQDRVRVAARWWDGLAGWRA